MSGKTVGLIILLVGVLVLAVSLLADVIGIGTQPAIIGWKQLVGAAVGLVFSAAGIAVMLRRTETSDG